MSINSTQKKKLQKIRLFEKKNIIYSIEKYVNEQWVPDSSGVIVGTTRAAQKLKESLGYDPEVQRRVVRYRAEAIL